MPAAMRRAMTGMAIAALLGIGSLESAAQASAGAPRGATSTALADSARALFTARGIPGGQVVILHGGRSVLNVNIGAADLAAARPVADTTLFRIGSISKLLTATAAALLWEKGALDIDAPVQALVPEFPATHAGVTARRLAGHLAGVRHYNGADFTRAPRHYDDVITALGIFAADSLKSAPGTRYLYSSNSYNLLGAAVQRAAHLSYARAIDSLVLAPNSMRLSRLESGSVVGGDIATGYDPPVTAPEVAARIDLSDRWPSGGWLSTATEIARFAEASVRGPLLSPRVRALLFTPMRTAADSATGVGFGWRVGKDPDGRTVYHHGGASVGGRAMLMVWRDESIVVAITTNLSNARITEKDAMALGRLASPPR